MAVRPLRIQQLGFGWETGGPLLFDRLDLQFEPGTVTSIVGRSGCGKSTLLRLAAGLLAPTTGTVDHGADSLGFVFQSPTLLPWRTVAENVALPLELSGDRTDAGDRIGAALASVGLADSATLLPAALSGGMQMRASLARALVTRPQLLLMDEPFGALDALTRREAWAVVQSAWAEAAATVLLVTHDIDEAVILADRVLVLSGTPSTIAGDFAVDIRRPRSPRDRFSDGVERTSRTVEALL